MAATSSVLPHSEPVESVLNELRTTRQGLAAGEPERRLAEHGPNELQAAQRVSAWSILAEQFKNVLVIILLIATGLSAFLGHGLEAIVITIIVLFAVLLGFIQEFRAERAMEALRQMAAPLATVVRDGSEQHIAAREVVPGDILLLRAGDKVAADSRLIEAHNLQLVEAALTGESLPVEKQTDPVPAEAGIGDRRNTVYAGTTVTYGRGQAVVFAIGMSTEFGKIAQLLQTVETSRTPLQENLDRVGRLLAYVSLGIVAAIVAAGMARGEPFVEILIFGIALAVAVVPEALPAVVTISLAIGVRRMVKRNALVRRLPVVETLGSTSVICSDKTGTLTKDEMTARRIVVADETWHLSGAGYEPAGDFLREGQAASPTPAVLNLLRGAVLACDAHIARDDDGRWRVQGDPTEGALIVAAAKAGLQQSELDAQFPREDEIPFTSESKRMTTLHRTPDGSVAYSKGAPEVILSNCTRQLTERGEEELNDDRRQQFLNTARQMAGEALRVLAVAEKRAADRATAERNMTILGLVGMIDPPRAEAKSAVETCKRAGIRVVMITGDHPMTAQAVARELGILEHGRVITGAELDALTDDDFDRDVEHIDVYARVAPEHKLRVVTALQRCGHISAMTGDGVNDAPALKKADIGIAMGITGTDVTKEAAAMTLTDDNFASIVAAVEEGRGIYGNIKKYIMYLLSSNIGEIGLVAGTSLLGLPLPLTAVQILYVNLATDGLPALALAVDPPETDLMDRPPRNPRVGLFSRPVVTLMVIAGVWSMLANLVLFAWALRSGRGQEEAMTMAFVSLVLIQFLKAYNFRSDHHSILHRPFANWWLNVAILWEIVMLFVIIYVPFLQDAFGAFSLTWPDWVIVGAAALTIVPVLEFAKWLFRHGWLGNSAEVRLTESRAPH